MTPDKHLVDYKQGLLSNKNMRTRQNEDCRKETRSQFLLRYIPDKRSKMVQNQPINQLLLNTWKETSLFSSHDNFFSSSKMLCLRHQRPERLFYLSNVRQIFPLVKRFYCPVEVPRFLLVYGRGCARSLRVPVLIGPHNFPLVQSRRASLNAKNHP